MIRRFSVYIWSEEEIEVKGRLRRRKEFNYFIVR